MAAAVCEEIERGPESFRALDVTIVPGITAMLAVAARIGAPLGHDFCALSLSDNLKPWELIERRLDAAAGAGFVMALYNPMSKSRPWQFSRAMERLAGLLPPTTPVVIGRAVGRTDETVSVTTLDRAGSIYADMATLVIVGSRETRARAACRPDAAGLHAARRRRDQRMIEPLHHGIDCVDRMGIGCRRPAHQDHLDAEVARGGDLAVRGVAAAVFGDDDFDAVGLHQRAVGSFTERTARGDVARVRQRQRRIDGIDAAEQINVLWRGGEGRKVVAAERDEYTARLSRRLRRPRRAVSLTSVQRSPATFIHGARRRAMKATPVWRAASAAFAEIALA